MRRRRSSTPHGADCRQSRGGRTARNCDRSAVATAMSLYETLGVAAKARQRDPQGLPQEGARLPPGQGRRRGGVPGARPRARSPCCRTTTGASCTRTTARSTTASSSARAPARATPTASGATSTTRVTSEKLDGDGAEYKGSAEEAADLAAAYRRAKGDMDKIADDMSSAPPTTSRATAGCCRRWSTRARCRRTARSRRRARRSASGGQPGARGARGGRARSTRAARPRRARRRAAAPTRCARRSSRARAGGRRASTRSSTRSPRGGRAAAASLGGGQAKRRQATRQGRRQVVGAAAPSAPPAALLVDLELRCAPSGSRPSPRAAPRRRAVGRRSTISDAHGCARAAVPAAAARRRTASISISSHNLCARGAGSTPSQHGSVARGASSAWARMG